MSSATSTRCWPLARSDPGGLSRHVSPPPLRPALSLPGSRIVGPHRGTVRVCPERNGRNDGDGPWPWRCSRLSPRTGAARDAWLARSSSTSRHRRLRLHEAEGRHRDECPLSESEGIEHVKESIQQILGTPIGSRVMRRDFGSRLRQIVFEPNDSTIDTLDLLRCHHARTRNPHLDLRGILLWVAKGTIAVSERDGA